MHIVGVFTEEDFMYEDCDEINSIILEEAKTFVTFMQTIVEELIGQEDYMMNMLYGKNLYKKSVYSENDDDSEDEDDEDE